MHLKQISKNLSTWQSNKFLIAARHATVISGRC